MGIAARGTRALKRLAHRMGFDVRRWPAPDPMLAQIVRILETLDVQVVLDVGANVGQYARQLRQAGYGGRIVSIEPSRATHAALTSSASTDPHWIVAPPMALGACDGTANLVLYNRSDMNSLRALGAYGRACFPRLAETGRETVPVRRLDDVFDELTGGCSAASTALKIDTQGAEREILRGAVGILDRLPLIQVELALTPLYDGAPALEEIYDLLRARGFRLAMTTPVSFDKKLGLPIEVDALFLRC